MLDFVPCVVIYCRLCAQFVFTFAVGDVALFGIFLVWSMVMTTVAASLRGIVIGFVASVFVSHSVVCCAGAASSVVIVRVGSWVCFSLVFLSSPGCLAYLAA